MQGAGTDTNKLFTLAGDRSTGKTTFIKECVRATVLPKTLIIDTFDNPVWHTMETFDYPEGINTPVESIAPEYLKFWRSGIYRLYGSNTAAIMKAIESDLRNCFLIFEDASKYFGKELTEDQKNFILDSKQKNLNILFAFHSLKDVPSDIARYTDYFTLKKVGDQFSSSLKNKFAQQILDMFHIVQAHPDKYFSLTWEK